MSWYLDILLPEVRLFDVVSTPANQPLTLNRAGALKTAFLKGILGNKTFQNAFSQGSPNQDPLEKSHSGRFFPGSGPP